MLDGGGGTLERDDARDGKDWGFPVDRSQLLCFVILLRELFCFYPQQMQIETIHFVSFHFPLRLK